MATIPEDSIVTLRASPPADLSYPPNTVGTLAVAVHRGALRAPTNHLTQLVQFNDPDLVWAGALDERMLNREEGAVADCRRTLASVLFDGTRVSENIRPGDLRLPGKARDDTVYRGQRPWIIVAGQGPYGILALPLNDVAGRIGSWHHRIAADDLLFDGSKDSKLEMNHLWAFPTSTGAVGTLAASARPAAEAAIRKYYS